MNVTGIKEVESGKMEISTATANLKTLANLTRGTFLYADLATGNLFEDRASWYNPYSWVCCSSDWKDVTALVDQTFASTIISPDHEIKKLVGQAYIGLTKLQLTYRWYGDDAEKAFKIIEERVNPFASDELNQARRRLLNGTSSASLTEFHKSPSFCCPVKRQSLEIKLEFQNLLKKLERAQLSPEKRNVRDLLRKILKGEQKTKEKSDFEKQIKEALNKLNKVEMSDADTIPKKKGSDFARIGGHQMVSVSSEELQNLKKGLKKVNPCRTTEEVNNNDLIAALVRMREYVALMESESDSEDSDSFWDIPEIDYITDEMGYEAEIEEE